MDIVNSIIGGLASIDMAKKAAEAALAVRDFNRAASELSAINDALLKTQNSLLSQNNTLFKLQRENAQLTQELAELKKALLQRDGYALVQVYEGTFAYRANIAPNPSGASDPGGMEPAHYVCQPCMDQPLPRKVVLQAKWSGSTPVLWCPVCDTKIQRGPSTYGAAVAAGLRAPGIL